MLRVSLGEIASRVARFARIETLSEDRTTASMLHQLNDQSSSLKPQARREQKLRSPGFRRLQRAIPLSVLRVGGNAAEDLDSPFTPRRVRRRMPMAARRGRWRGRGGEAEDPRGASVDRVQKENGGTKPEVCRLYANVSHNRISELACARVYVYVYVYALSCMMHAHPRGASQILETREGRRRRALISDLPRGIPLFLEPNLSFLP